MDLPALLHPIAQRHAKSENALISPSNAMLSISKKKPQKQTQIHEAFHRRESLAHAPACPFAHVPPTSFIPRSKLPSWSLRRILLRILLDPLGLIFSGH